MRCIDCGVLSLVDKNGRCDWCSLVKEAYEEVELTDEQLDPFRRSAEYDEDDYGVDQ